MIKTPLGTDGVLEAQLRETYTITKKKKIRNKENSFKV